jgi:hypothetical protein
MSWLLYHPESDCYLCEVDPEVMVSHLDQGCEDVTGIDFHEKAHMVQQHAKHLQADKRRAFIRQKVFRDILIKQQRYPSCLNCVNWYEDKCTLFKAVPPPEVIVFSCLEAWEADIPF